MNRKVEVTFIDDKEARFVLRCKEDEKTLSSKEIFIGEQDNMDNAKAQALDTARKSKTKCQFDGELA